MGRNGFIPWLLSRRTGFMLCIMGFLITMCVMNMAIMQTERPSEDIKEDVVSLSRQYVKKLARENEDIVDGPYAGRYTGFDLKKTLAILLDNLMTKVDRLETRVDNVAGNMSELRQSFGTSMNSSPSWHQSTVFSNGPDAVDVRRLIQGNLPDCSIPRYSELKFPSCKDKIEYMRRMWKMDPCYAHYGVDGTNCSFIMYLSEVETWCPKLPWRQNQEESKTDSEKVVFKTDKGPLLAMLVDAGSGTPRYTFVRKRIEESWDRWVSAFANLHKGQNMEGRTKKKIILHLGLLMKGSMIRDFQDKGGPLGELVQWSDLITTLYILGHDISITSETAELFKYIDKILGERRWRSCPSKGKSHVDLIYTDIMGLRQLERNLKSNLHQLGCLLRIVDSFGTEPAFNFEPYAKAHKLKSAWGKHNLNPQQFFTMFPHSPDNSFMGFVIPSLHSAETTGAPFNRTNHALVYGKRKEYWNGKRHYIDVLNEMLELHGTVYENKGDNMSDLVPDYVINHGFLNFSQLVKLLRSSKIFIGMGFPFEGPAPLEAISAGCVVIQPKFKTPLSSLNSNFFKGKPTMRELKSQHPYIEDYIGEPHVYSINMEDDDEVRLTVKKILNNPPVVGYMPYEFTEEGMLQRMNTYIERQEFCQGLDDWVPASAITVELGTLGKSCKVVCQEKGLVCEPSHFSRINNETFFKAKGIECPTISPEADTHYPAYKVDGSTCILQNQHMLFSCVTKRPELQRLCPCRDFIRGQTALCHGCL